MQSSPSGPDPLDPGPRGFAHRGLHGDGVPENSLAAFRAAIDYGAGIECDLRLTADNKLVVFHDADARRLCASPLAIGRSSLAELADLRVGSHPIPTLENALELAKGRTPLLLELKANRDVSRWVDVLKRSLAGYSGRFALMSFNAWLCRRVRLDLPNVRRGLLLKDRQSKLGRSFAMRIAAPDFLGIERSAVHKQWVAEARTKMPVYCWTVRTAAERAQAEVQADALIWEGDGRPRN